MLRKIFSNMRLKLWHLHSPLPTVFFSQGRRIYYLNFNRNAPEWMLLHKYFDLWNWIKLWRKSFCSCWRKIASGKSGITRKLFPNHWLLLSSIIHSAWFDFNVNRDTKDERILCTNISHKIRETLNANWKTIDSCMIKQRSAQFNLTRINFELHIKISINFYENWIQILNTL